MRTAYFSSAIIAMLLLLCTALSGQDDYKDYLVKARTHLANGDTLRAAQSYQVYRRLTGASDSLFESRLYPAQDSLTEQVPSGKKSAKRKFSPGRNFTERAFGINMPMVYVSGGDFLMFDQSEQLRNARTDELPLRYMKVGNYYIGQCEVTQGQWAAVMGGNIAKLRDNANPKYSLYGSGRNYPVYYVTYEEAEEFCRRLSSKTGRNYRLPTEAEWEYAAQGGARSRHFLYSGSDNMNNAGWCLDNSGGSSHHVGGKRSNELGIYDMSGNVMEWCSAPFGPDRIYRGGNWSLTPSGCRISSRGSMPATGRDCHLGFRVVLQYE